MANNGHRTHTQQGRLIVSYEESYHFESSLHISNTENFLVKTF